MTKQVNNKPLPTHAAISKYKFIGINKKATDVILSKHTSTTKYFFGSFLKDWLGMIGLVVFVLMLLGMIFFPIFADDPNEAFLNADGTSLAFAPPSAEHWFGTNDIGNDLWSRIWHGTGTSFAIGFCVMVITFFISLIFGILMANFLYFDRLMQAIIKVMLSIPNIILYISIFALLSPVTSRVQPTVASEVFQYTIIFSIVQWMGTSNLVRSQILRVKNLDFITASRILGTPRYKILSAFVPMGIPILLTNLVIIVPAVIIGQAGLVLISGFNDIRIPTLGLELAYAAPQTLVYPSMTIFASLFLLLLSISMYFISNATQEALAKKR